MNNENHYVVTVLQISPKAFYDCLLLPAAGQLLDEICADNDYTFTLLNERIIVRVTYWRYIRDKNDLTSFSCSNVPLLVTWESENQVEEDEEKTTCMIEEHMKKNLFPLARLFTVKREEAVAVARKFIADQKVKI